MAGNKRDHGQHHGRQKAEYGDGLQNIQNRDHPRFNARVVGGDVSVGDGKGETQKVSDADAHHGVESVGRQRADGVRDGHHGDRLPQPVGAGGDNREKECQANGSHAHIDEEWPGAGSDEGSRKGMEFHSASSLGAISSSSASGMTKRRRPASKSNSSA